MGSSEEMAWTSPWKQERFENALWPLGRMPFERLRHVETVRTEPVEEG